LASPDLQFEDFNPLSGVAVPPPIGVAARYRTRILLLAVGLLAAIGMLELRFNLDYSLGVFYIFPVMTAAMALSRTQVIACAAFCAWFRSLFVPELPPIEYWLRFLMAFLAYGGAGLLVCEVNRNRRRLSGAYTQLQYEQQMRHEAEHQLRILAESSPAAIVTLNARSEVLAANSSAHELLGYDEPGSLLGRSLADHVPVFAAALHAGQNKRVRTSTASWAKRADGAQFPVMTWFSTYTENGERYLAGILVDVSEDVRERERENFRHIYYNNRLTASAVSHEVRNLCLALRVVASNLAKRPDLQETPDFSALTTLIENLTRLSSFELRQRLDGGAGKADIRAVIEQWRLIVEPDWLDVGGDIQLEIADQPLLANADPHMFLQVLLNLSQNSLRALQGSPERTLIVRARCEGRSVCIDFIDSGPGIADPSKLFQPFKEGSSGSGLGLYVSRNLVRSFAGDLTFVPAAKGCCFRVALPLWEPVK
jgi:two-component system, LuxR family, sensor kinase FixL